LLSASCFGAVIITDSLGRIPIGKNMQVLQPDREIPFDTVLRSARFKSIPTDIPNLGASANSIWLRFSLDNRSSRDHLLLEVAYPILDEVELYIPDTAGGYLATKLGESVRFRQRNYQQPTYIFDIDIAPGAAGTYYLRVKSSEHIILPVYLNEPVALWEDIGWQNLINGIYLGVILIMAVYNLFLYFSVNDRSYIYYVIYVCFVGLTQIGIKGYTYQYLWPDNPYFESKSIVLFAAIGGIAVLLFTREFLHVKENYPRVNLLLSALIAVFIASIVLIFIDKDQAGFLVMQINTTFFTLTIFGVSLAIMVKGYPPAKFFFIAWSVFLTGSVIFLLKDYGVLPYNTFTSTVMQSASAIEMALLSFGLANRINILKKEREQSRLEALRIAKENSRIIKEQNVILESKVKERTEELLQKNEELNTTLEDLQQAQMQLVESEKMASLGQLTAGIAHEINNPINFVTGNIGPLKRDVEVLFHTIDKLEAFQQMKISDEEKVKLTARFKEDQEFDYLKTEIQHLLRGIHEGASRTAEIVKSLRIFSRLDEDDLKLADINEGLESTLIIVNNLLGHITITRQYGHLPLVNCYPGKLNQVFLNIISNGIHAINEKFGEQPGGKLIIATHRTGGHVYISFADNGTGMTEETRRKIFEPFFTTKDVGQGTGLGMSIAFNTIQKHNGQIQVESELGIGTRFTIKLPIEHTGATD